MNPVNRQPEWFDFFFDELPNFDLTPLSGDELPNFDLTPLSGDELPNFDLSIARGGASADEKTQHVVQESFQALPEKTQLPVAEDQDVEERPVKRRKRKHPSKQALAAREYRLRKKEEKNQMVSELILLREENRELRQRVAQLESLLTSQSFKSSLQDPFSEHNM